MLAAKPGKSEAVSRATRTNLADHHLAHAQVGDVAVHADAGSVVAKHFSGSRKNQPGHLHYLEGIAAAYEGPFLVADDMYAF